MNAVHGRHRPRGAKAPGPHWSIQLGAFGGKVDAAALSQDEYGPCRFSLLI
jgi:hypothetical protein